MTRTTVALWALCTACYAGSRGYVLPKIDEDPKTIKYTEQALSDDAEIIPAPLLFNPKMYAQARSCAIAYNEAVRVSKTCDVANYALRAIEVTGVAGATFSSAVASFVPDADAAHPAQSSKKRQWQEAALAFTAAFAITSGFDLFLNCEKRSADQIRLAIDHQRALLSAARDLACADSAEAAACRQKQLKAKAEELLKKRAPSKDTKPATGSDDATTKALETLKQDAPDAETVKEAAATLKKSADMDTQEAGKDAEDLAKTMA